MELVKIVGLWELGYNTPLIELDQWQYPLRDFSVDEFYMTPVTGIRSDYVKEIHDMAEFLDQQRNMGLQIVFVDEKGTTELQQFEHPQNVVYVFGKASISPMQAYYKEGDQSLLIRTKFNGGLLWPHQCAVTILYDRMNKCQY